MPGIGGHWWILLILAIVALIIFGPSRLPELGSGLGKAIKEFRKATTEVGEGLREELRKPDSATGTTYTQQPSPPAPPVETAPPAATPASTPAAGPPPEAPQA